MNTIFHIRGFIDDELFEGTYEYINSGFSIHTDYDGTVTVYYLDVRGKWQEITNIVDCDISLDVY